MQIRGIDFARHTVIVSSGEAEPGLPNLSGPGGNGRSGELVARVVNVVGGEATLEVGGQRVVVQTHVPLNLGERLWLQAEEELDGQLRLSLQQRQGGAPGLEQGTKLPALPTAEGALLELLDELGLPQDPKAQLVAKALIARDGTLDGAAMKRLLVDLRGQAQPSPALVGAAALLQKAEVAVSPTNLAWMMQRPTPEGPSQLGPVLARVQQALTAFVGASSGPGPARAQALALQQALGGLPLEAPAQPARVEAALREWLVRLDPQWSGGGPSAGAPPKGVGLPQGAGTQGPTGPVPEGLGESAAPPTLAVAQALAALEAELPAWPEEGQGAAPALAKAPLPEEGQRLLQRLLSKAEGRAEGPAPGPTPLPQPEGEAKARPPLPELGRQLEQLAKHDQVPPALKQVLREALAELRYTQIVNQVPQQAPAAGQLPPPVAYMVPLMAPQLHPDQPLAQLQVHHRPKRPGEPIDPNNLRLLISLPTEHLETVQVEVVVKDGVVGLNLGVEAAEDRALVASHLPELEQAIGQLGWPVGRVAARAKQPWAPVRQEQAASGEFHHVDRRV